MNIALVILHAAPMRGGAERYTVDLASALARLGHEVSLLATTFSAEPGNEVRRVDLSAGGMTRTARYRRMLDALDAHLDRQRYDIVHAMLPVRRCDLYHPHAGLAAAAVAANRLAAAFNPRRRRFAEVERALLGSSRPPLVLCLSDYVKRQIRNYYPLDETHLPVLFNAVDLDRFDPASQPRSRGQDGQVQALIIAQDFARKGLRQAILALGRVNDPRLVLRVIGKENPSAYQRLAAQAGVRDRVQFAGPTRDPASAYRNADFFVLPTRHDPCSLVVLESLAMGLPAITTRCNGACEMIRDGVHGFVLNDPDDVDALADAMRRMLDADLRGRMSAACLELRPALAYERHLARLLQLYEGLRSQPHGPAAAMQRN